MLSPWPVAMALLANVSTFQVGYRGQARVAEPLSWLCGTLFSRGSGAGGITSPPPPVWGALLTGLCFKRASKGQGQGNQAGDVSPTVNAAAGPPRRRQNQAKEGESNGCFRGAFFMVYSRLGSKASLGVAC